MSDNERDFRVDLEEFLEYYTNVSASIDDDMYFAAMMNSAWNLSGDASQYKSYGKGWAAEDNSATKRPQTTAGGYTRKNLDPDGVPTLRSGMVSSEFPFNHMQKYYEKKKDESPVRTSLANPK